MSSVSCVTWDGEDEEWVNDGCEPVEVTPNYTVCSCSHLSSFTLLENTSAEGMFRKKKKISVLNNVPVIFSQRCLAPPGPGPAPAIFSSDIFYCALKSVLSINYCSCCSTHYCKVIFNILQCVSVLLLQ